MNTIAQPLTFKSLQQMAALQSAPKAQPQAPAAAPAPHFGLKTVSFAGEIRPAAPEHAGKRINFYA